MKRTITRIAAGLLLCGTVTVGVRAYYANQDDGGPNVTTSRVTRGSLAEAVSATGTLQAVTTVQVGAQVSGTVSWLGADFNSLVHKGQVIAKLDPSSLQSQVDQARAGLARTTADAESTRAQAAAAQQELARIEALQSKGIISQSDLESAMLASSLAKSQVSSSDAQIVQARASVAQAELNLGHTIIAAPIDGIVIQRNVDVGQTISASQSSPTLFAIAANLAQLQVSAKIDESDIGRIRPSQSVTFKVDAYAGRSFTGKVLQVRLEPTLLQSVVTYNVIIDAPNPDLALKPGMTANVTIEIAKRDDVVRIPNAALRFRPSADMYALLGQKPIVDSARPLKSSTPVGSAALPPIATEQASPIAPGKQNAGATTIDALFGTLAPVESDGRVWLYANTQLKSVPLHLGITDGQTTELLSGDLQAGAELVTNVTTPGASVRASAAAAGIFMQNSGGRSPGGAGGRSGPTGR